MSISQWASVLVIFLNNGAGWRWDRKPLCESGSQPMRSQLKPHENSMFCHWHCTWILNVTLCVISSFFFIIAERGANYAGVTDKKKTAHTHTRCTTCQREMAVVNERITTSNVWYVCPINKKKKKSRTHAEESYRLHQSCAGAHTHRWIERTLLWCT